MPKKVCYGGHGHGHGGGYHEEPDAEHEEEHGETEHSEVDIGSQYLHGEDVEPGDEEDHEEGLSQPPLHLPPPGSSYPSSYYGSSYDGGSSPSTFEHGHLDPGEVHNEDDLGGLGEEALTGHEGHDSYQGYDGEEHGGGDYIDEDVLSDIHDLDDWGDRRAMRSGDLNNATLPLSFNDTLALPVSGATPQDNGTLSQFPPSPFKSPPTFPASSAFSRVFGNGNGNSSSLPAPTSPFGSFPSFFGGPPK